MERTFRDLMEALGEPEAENNVSVCVQAYGKHASSQLRLRLLVAAPRQALPWCKHAHPGLLLL